MGIAAFDDDVARGQQRRKLLQDRVHDLMRHHDPEHSGRGERGGEVLQRAGAFGPVRLHLPNGLGIQVEGDHLVPVID